VLATLWIVAVLGVLEVSLSFDNAVVNATVLRDMDAVWRRRFLSWGIIIAVFGMRIVFPLAIVAIAAKLGPIDAIRLRATEPATYERIITGAHVGIAGFGGAFLGMVGLAFFLGDDKDVHWIGAVEKRAVAAGERQGARDRDRAARPVRHLDAAGGGGRADLPRARACSGSSPISWSTRSES
jgi:hypothetical protein